MTLIEKHLILLLEYYTLKLVVHDLFNILVTLPCYWSVSLISHIVPQFCIFHTFLNLGCPSARLLPSISLSIIIPYCNPSSCLIICPINLHHFSSIDLNNFPDSSTSWSLLWLILNSIRLIFSIFRQHYTSKIFNYIFFALFITHAKSHTNAFINFFLF